jgi:hypothetical protein
MENGIRKNQRQARKSYVVYGGLLQVDEGRQLAFEKANPTAKSAIQRRCGICKVPGHTRRKCLGIQDFIHVIIL